MHVPAVAVCCRASVAVLLALLAPVALSWPLAAGAAGPVPVVASRTSAESAWLIARSPYSLSQTIERVKAAALGHNMTFIREQSLDYGLVEPARESTRGRILYFCDFGMLNDVLKVDKRVGMFLPCQVSVIDTDNGVVIVTPNPGVLRKQFFGNERLHGACELLRQTYAEILDEATM